MSEQKRKYLMWFVCGFVAHGLIRDAIIAYNIPWTGTADQTALATYTVLALILILLVGASIVWVRMFLRPPNSN